MTENKFELQSYFIGNIVHELVTESFTNQKTRLTIVHERLFSINRLVSLVSPISTKRTITS
jgi:hypothetical protein